MRRYPKAPKPTELATLKLLYGKPVAHEPDCPAQQGARCTCQPDLRHCAKQSEGSKDE